MAQNNDTFRIFLDVLNEVLDKNTTKKKKDKIAQELEREFTKRLEELKNG